MGEAKRRAAHVAAGGADWGLRGFRNSGGRKACRVVGKMLFVSARLERDEFGGLHKLTVDGSAHRSTPRRHELRKVLRRAQGRGR